MMMHLIGYLNNIKESKNMKNNKIIVKKFNSSMQFSCNIYIISSKLGNILIDPGYYDNTIKNYIDEIGGLDAILLTHGHFDHIYGLDKLKEDYKDVPVYIYEKEYEFLKDPYLNSSLSFGFELIINSKVNKIKEGIIHIKDYEINVINTPRHTKGSVLYYFKNEKILFTGDTIMKDFIGNSYRPTGSEKDMIKSINKFKNLGCSFDTLVYPGHEEITTYGYILKNNIYIIEN